MDEKKEGGFGLGAVIGLIVAVALVFGAIGYWAGRNKTEKLGNKGETATAIASKTPAASLSATAATSATNEATGRKTYENTDYGYQMKYPDDWVVDIKDKTSIAFYTSENAKLKEKLEAEQAETEGPTPEVLIVYYSNLKEINTDSSKNYSTLEEMVNDQTTFRDTKATTFVGQSAFETIESGMLDNFEYIMEKDGHIYKVRIPNKTSKTELTSIESSVLSSFQFTK